MIFILSKGLVRTLEKTPDNIKLVTWIVVSFIFLLMSDNSSITKSLSHSFWVLITFEILIWINLDELSETLFCPVFPFFARAHICKEI
jgi:hypothetical protein